MKFTISILLLFLSTIAAFWISAISGGGASLILIPILNIILSPTYVPFALTVGTFSSSASRIIVFKKYIHWKIFFWFVPFSIPAVLLGAWLMKFLNPLYLQIFVALFLIANLPELLKNKKQLKNEEKPFKKYILAIVGFIAGFVSGVTGAVGLLFNRFYLKYGLTKEQIIATRAANEVTLHLIKLIIYFLLGLYSREAIFFGVTVAVGSITSSYTVKYLLPYISEYLFRKIGYGTMVISGVFLFISTSGEIIKKDRISFEKNKYNETVINWRESKFVLEFSIGDGLEIERQITYQDLPIHLKKEYDELKKIYDKIFLEIVYKIGQKRSYEFYCYKDKYFKKYEFE